MIVVDTSALMAIVLNERQADDCAYVLESEDRLLISAGTAAEVLIVAGRRNVRDEVNQLINGLGFEIISVTSASARRIVEVYDRWGKGVHPAALNYGDCFAFELAKELNCRLLYAGDDFTRTDIQSALC